MSKSVVLALVASVMCSLASWAQAELVDNPNYKSWASHGVGTKVSYTQEMKMTGMNMKHEMTQTLLEVTPEQAVVEVSMIMDMGGQKHEQKSKMNIKSKVEAGQEYMPPNTKGTVKEVGKETVAVDGKSYECKVLEMTSDSEQAKMTGKTWVCEKVPGNLVKNEMTITSPQEMTTSLTISKIEAK